MKCNNCDTILKSNYRYCPECGHKNNYRKNANNNSFGWGVLGFFVPLAGLILFIMWSSTRKDDARAAGIGALINTILNVIFIIFYMIIIFMITAGAISSAI